MFFAYLSLGIVVAAAIHYGLKFFQNAAPQTIAKTLRFALISAVIIIIVLLLRMGLIHLAAIISFVSVALPLITRALSVKAAWHQAQPPTAATGRMTEKDAREILGVDENASPADIRAAYHRLIAKNHPDQGGSKYLASQINAARDLLLKEED